MCKNNNQNFKEAFYQSALNKNIPIGESSILQFKVNYTNNEKATFMYQNRLPKQLILQG